MEQALITRIATEIINSTQGGRVLYLASGGSSIPISVAALNMLPSEVRTRTTLTLTDERYGVAGHADSNWKQMIDKGLRLEGLKLLPILSVESITKEEIADTFDTKLRIAIKDSDTVIALFGIGADHHIAGILPESPAAMESEKLACAYDAGAYKRITITPSVFRNINLAFIYAKGESKREAVDSLAGDLPFVLHPNQLARRCGRYVVTFVP